MKLFVTITLYREVEARQKVAADLSRPSILVRVSLMENYKPVLGRGVEAF